MTEPRVDDAKARALLAAIDATLMQVVLHPEYRERAELLILKFAEKLLVLMQGTVKVEPALLPIWRELLANMDAGLVLVSGQAEDVPVGTRH